MNWLISQPVCYYATDPQFWFNDTESVVFEPVLVAPHPGPPPAAPQQTLFNLKNDFVLLLCWSCLLLYFYLIYYIGNSMRWTIETSKFTIKPQPAGELAVNWYLILSLVYIYFTSFTLIKLGFSFDYPGSLVKGGVRNIGSYRALYNLSFLSLFFDLRFQYLGCYFAPCNQFRLDMILYHR